MVAAPWRLLEEQGKRNQNLPHVSLSAYLFHLGGHAQKFSGLILTLHVGITPDSSWETCGVLGILYGSAAASKCLPHCAISATHHSSHFWGFCFVFQSSETRGEIRGTHGINANNYIPQDEMLATQVEWISSLF